MLWSAGKDGSHGTRRVDVPGEEGNNRLQTLRRESQQSLTLVKLKG